MANLPCPEKLIIDCNASNAELVYHHWRVTFMNFFSLYFDQSSNKLHYLTSYFSAQFYKYFTDTSSYEEALTILNRIYINKKNEMVSRHLLAPRHQLPSDSIDRFHQALIKLSKDNLFSLVAVEQYQAKLIQNAFINELWSRDIQQRTLENSTLTLQQAYD